MHQLTPEAQFGRLLATDASRPFVTYYDERTGERSELSVKSLANWVAKTHHLLGDELGLGVGNTALVALPAHWISVPVLLGCLTAGLTLIEAADPKAGDADVAFVAPDSLAAAGSIPDVYAIAPASAAVGLRDAVPGGAEDYVVAVRPQADAWSSVDMPASGDDAAVGTTTRTQLAARAAERAAQLGLVPGGRLLSARDWSGADDWMDAVFAPLSVGGSLVLVRNCADEDVLARRTEQERATVRI